MFAVKASRYLTHIKRLVDIRDGIARFYEPLEPMVQAGRLGPVLWQLPENFHRDDARLAGWLEVLPSGLHTIEFRHRSWFVPEVMDALRAHGVALTIGDHPERPFQTDRGHRGLALRPLPLRLARSRRQLLRDRDRHVGAADRPVAPARDRVRVLQQRLAGIRAGQRRAAAAPAGFAVAPVLART